MNNLVSNIGHIIVTTIIIAAVSVLAWHGTISGGTAVAIIAGIGGVSVGGGVASASAGVQPASSVAVSTSPGTSTLTVGPTQVTATPTMTTDVTSAPSTTAALP